MKALLMLAGLVAFLAAESKTWQTKRNPFLVSQSYIERTGKHYLVPKDTYITVDMALKGVFMRDGVKKVLLHLEDGGFVYIGEGDEQDIETSDVRSRLKILEINDGFVMLSVNGGESVRYELK